VEIVEVDTPDVTLSCAVAGEGPVVIAVHGFPDSRSTFFRCCRRWPITRS